MGHYFDRIHLFLCTLDLILKIEVQGNDGDTAESGYVVTIYLVITLICLLFAFLLKAFFKKAAKQKVADTTNVIIIEMNQEQHQETV